MHRIGITRRLTSLIAGLLTVLATAGGGVLLNTSTASAALPTPPFNQCPKVGWDTSCQLLIVINPDGSVVTLSDPGQGAFDGVEDTLIGVQNNSSFGVSSMDLVGAGAPFVGPFNFDGDGLCSGVQSSSTSTTPGNSTFFPPPAGCPFGPTKYEGKATSFSNYSPTTGCSTCTGNTGTVTFTASLPRGQQGIAAGGSAYFSLEGKVTPSLVVSIDPLITASGVTFSATEGVTFSGTVATFTDPDTSATAAEYSATINWGDSSPTTAGTITGGSGSFTVSGTHLYKEEGTYAVTVTISDIDNSANRDTASSTAKVSDAALTSKCAAPPVSAQAFTGPTAVFTDQSSTGTLSDFSATINWGDTTSSPGTIVGGPGNAPYTVTGSHTYTSTGTFTVTTTINDVGGSTTTAKCSVIVFAFATSKQAAFVIGDLEATIGNHVTWWSSSWAMLNPMSGPTPPPNSMKGFAGFEDNPLGLPPACGRTWTTDTGNATPPPASVPDVMGVIVSSTVTQSGSVVSGNIVEVAIVKNDPGYAPDPGHQGTGTVLAVICL